MTMKLNEIEAYSGSIILPSLKDIAEISINDVLFQISFEDDGKQSSSQFNYKNEKAGFVFKNITEPLGVSFSFDLPLLSGGKTEVYFVIYTIGQGTGRTIFVNYTYRNVK